MRTEPWETGRSPEIQQILTARRHVAANESGELCQALKESWVGRMKKEQSGDQESRG